MVNCIICQGSFEKSQDEIVLCEHKGGFVHFGCCVHRCAWDNKPCQNSKAIYSKIGK